MQPACTEAGKLAGRIQDDIYHTNRRRSVHQLRQPPAWAIDAAILGELRAAGVKRVEVRETEGGQTYTTTLETFFKHGIALDRGHGRQIALPLAYWRVDGRRSLAEQQAEREPAPARQMSLFEVSG